MKAQKPINIILLGDPAAGKATQSQILCEKYGLYDFDMGKALRKILDQRGEVAKELDATYSQGKLSPTQIVRAIHKQVIYNTPSDQGILFDGTPKMLGEAKLIIKHLINNNRRDPVVIYLSVPIEETIERMTSRTEYFDGKFSKRTDDNIDALKERVKYYRKNISQVVKLFEEKYGVRKIDGRGSVEEVRKRIQEYIDEKVTDQN